VQVDVQENKEVNIMTDFNMFFKKYKGYFVAAGVVLGFIMILTYVCCCIKFIDHFLGEPKKEDYRVIAQATLPHSKAVADFREESFEIDASIIEESVMDVSSLSVIKKTYLEEVSFEDYKKGNVFDKDFNVPFTKKYITLGMDVYVNAGVDFSKVKQEDITVDDMTVYINLPRAEFFDIYADSESIVICEESENFLNQISTSDIASQMVAAEELARSDAYKDRVLDDAEDRTEKLLVEAVKAVYPDEDIEVKVLWNSIE